MASNEDHFLPVQRAYKAGHRSRNADDAERARANDTKSHTTLKKLLKQPGNKHCSDCTSQHAGWGVLPWGTFVCIDCAQIHRLIGKHVSQTKGINTNTYLWHDDEILVMQHFGNTGANGRLLGTHPAGIAQRVEKNATPMEKERFVRRKYEQMEWFTNAKSTSLSRGEDLTRTTSKLENTKKSAHQKTKHAATPTATAPDLLSFDVVEPTCPKIRQDFFAQFDNIHLEPATMPNTKMMSRAACSVLTSSQSPQQLSRAQVHASKASSVMAAFRQAPNSPLQGPQQQGFTHMQQRVCNQQQAVSARPGAVARNHNMTDHNMAGPLNIGFFESFGLSAH